MESSPHGGDASAIESPTGLTLGRASCRDRQTKDAGDGSDGLAQLGHAYASDDGEEELAVSRMQSMHATPPLGDSTSPDSSPAGHAGLRPPQHDLISPDTSCPSAHAPRLLALSQAPSLSTPAIIPSRPAAAESHGCAAHVDAHHAAAPQASACGEHQGASGEGHAGTISAAAADDDRVSGMSLGGEDRSEEGEVQCGIGSGSVEHIATDHVGHLTGRSARGEPPAAQPTVQTSMHVASAASAAAAAGLAGGAGAAAAKGPGNGAAPRTMMVRALRGPSTGRTWTMLIKSPAQAGTTGPAAQQAQGGPVGPGPHARDAAAVPAVGSHAQPQAASLAAQPGRDDPAAGDLGPAELASPRSSAAGHADERDDQGEHEEAGRKAQGDNQETVTENPVANKDGTEEQGVEFWAKAGPEQEVGEGRPQQGPAAIASAGRRMPKPIERSIERPFERYSPTAASPTAKGRSRSRGPTATARSRTTSPARHGASAQRKRRASRSKSPEDGGGASCPDPAFEPPGAAGNQQEALPPREHHERATATVCRNRIEQLHLIDSSRLAAVKHPGFPAFQQHRTEAVMSHSHQVLQPSSERAQQQLMSLPARPATPVDSHPAAGWKVARQERQQRSRRHDLQQVGAAMQAAAAGAVATAAAAAENCAAGPSEPGPNDGRLGAAAADLVPLIQDAQQASGHVPGQVLEDEQILFPSGATATAAAADAVAGAAGVMASSPGPHADGSAAMFGASAAGADITAPAVAAALGPVPQPHGTAAAGEAQPVAAERLALAPPVLVLPDEAGTDFFMPAVGAEERAVWEGMEFPGTGSPMDRMAPMWHEPGQAASQVHVPDLAGCQEHGVKEPDQAKVVQEQEASAAAAPAAAACQGLAHVQSQAAVADAQALDMPVQAEMPVPLVAMVPHVATHDQALVGGQAPILGQLPSAPEPVPEATEEGQMTVPGQVPAGQQQPSPAQQAAREMVPSPDQAPADVVVPEPEQASCPEQATPAHAECAPAAQGTPPQLCASGAVTDPVPRMAQAAVAPVPMEMLDQAPVGGDAAGLDQAAAGMLRAQDQVTASGGACTLGEQAAAEQPRAQQPGMLRSESGDGQGAAGSGATMGATQQSEQPPLAWLKEQLEAQYGWAGDPEEYGWSAMTLGSRTRVASFMHAEHELQTTLEGVAEAMGLVPLAQARGSTLPTQSAVAQPQGSQPVLPPSFVQGQQQGQLGVSTCGGLFAEAGLHRAPHVQPHQQQGTWQPHQPQLQHPRHVLSSHPGSPSVVESPGPMRTTAAPQWMQQQQQQQPAWVPAGAGQVRPLGFVPLDGVAVRQPEQASSPQQAMPVQDQVPANADAGTACEQAAAEQPDMLCLVSANGPPPDQDSMTWLKERLASKYGWHEDPAQHGWSPDALEVPLTEKWLVRFVHRDHGLQQSLEGVAGAMGLVRLPQASRSSLLSQPAVAQPQGWHPLLPHSSQGQPPHVAGRTLDVSTSGGSFAGGAAPFPPMHLQGAWQQQLLQGGWQQLQTQLQQPQRMLPSLPGPIPGVGSLGALHGWMQQQQPAWMLGAGQARPLGWGDLLPLSAAHPEQSTHPSLPVAGYGTASAAEEWQGGEREEGPPVDPYNDEVIGQFWPDLSDPNGANGAGGSLLNAALDEDLPGGLALGQQAGAGVVQLLPAATSRGPRQMRDQRVQPPKPKAHGRTRSMHELSRQPPAEVSQPAVPQPGVSPLPGVPRVSGAAQLDAENASLGRGAAAADVAADVGIGPEPDAQQAAAAAAEGEHAGAAATASHASASAHATEQAGPSGTAELDAGSGPVPAAAAATPVPAPVLPSAPQPVVPDSPSHESPQGSQLQPVAPEPEQAAPRGRARGGRGSKPASRAASRARRSRDNSPDPGHASGAAGVGPGAAAGPAPDPKQLPPTVGADTDHEPSRAHYMAKLRADLKTDYGYEGPLDDWEAVPHQKKDMSWYATYNPPGNQKQCRSVPDVARVLGLAVVKIPRRRAGAASAATDATAAAAAVATASAAAAAFAASVRGGEAAGSIAGGAGDAVAAASPEGAAEGRPCAAAAAPASAGEACLGGLEVAGQPLGGTAPGGMAPIGMPRGEAAGDIQSTGAVRQQDQEQEGGHGRQEAAAPALEAAVPTAVGLATAEQLASGVQHAVASEREEGRTGHAAVTAAGVPAAAATAAGHAAEPAGSSRQLKPRDTCFIEAGVQQLPLPFFNIEATSAMTWRARVTKQVANQKTLVRGKPFSDASEAARDVDMLNYKLHGPSKRTNFPLDPHVRMYLDATSQEDLRSALKQDGAELRASIAAAAAASARGPGTAAAPAAAAPAAAAADPAVAAEADPAVVSAPAATAAAGAAPAATTDHGDAVVPQPHAAVAAGAVAAAVLPSQAAAPSNSDLADQQAAAHPATTDAAEPLHPHTEHAVPMASYGDAPSDLQLPAPGSAADLCVATATAAAGLGAVGGQAAPGGMEDGTEGAEDQEGEEGAIVLDVVAERGDQEGGGGGGGGVGGGEEEVHGAPGDAGTAVAAATAAAAAGAAESSAPQPTQRHSTSPSHRPQDFKYIKSNKAGTRWQALLSYKTTSGKWTQFRGHLVRNPADAAMDADMVMYKAHGPNKPLNFQLEPHVRSYLDAMSLEHLTSTLKSGGSTAVRAAAAAAAVPGPGTGGDAVTQPAEEPSAAEPPEHVVQHQQQQPVAQPAAPPTAEPLQPDEHAAAGGVLAGLPPAAHIADIGPVDANGAAAAAGPGAAADQGVTGAPGSGTAGEEGQGGEEQPAVQDVAAEREEEEEDDGGVGGGEEEGHGAPGAEGEAGAGEAEGEGGPGAGTGGAAPACPDFMAQLRQFLASQYGVQVDLEQHGWTVSSLRRCSKGGEGEPGSITWVPEFRRTGRPGRGLQSITKAVAAVAKALGLQEGAARGGEGGGRVAAVEAAGEEGAVAGAIGCEAEGGEEGQAPSEHGGAAAGDAEEGGEAHGPGVNGGEQIEDGPAELVVDGQGGEGGEVALGQPLATGGDAGGAVVIGGGPAGASPEREPGAGCAAAGGAVAGAGAAAGAARTRPPRSSKGGRLAGKRKPPEPDYIADLEAKLQAELGWAGDLAGDGWTAKGSYTWGGGRQKWHPTFMHDTHGKHKSWVQVARVLGLLQPEVSDGDDDDDMAEHLLPDDAPPAKRQRGNAGAASLAHGSCAAAAVAAAAVAAHAAPAAQIAGSDAGAPNEEAEQQAACCMARLREILVTEYHWPGDPAQHGWAVEAKQTPKRGSIFWKPHFKHQADPAKIFRVYSSAAAAVAQQLGLRKRDTPKQAPQLPTLQVSAPMPSQSSPVHTQHGGAGAGASAAAVACPTVPAGLDVQDAVHTAGPASGADPDQPASQLVGTGAPVAGVSAAQDDAQLDAAVRIMRSKLGEHFEGDDERHPLQLQPWHVTASSMQLPARQPRLRAPGQEQEQPQQQSLPPPPPPPQQQQQAHPQEEQQQPQLQPSSSSPTQAPHPGGAQGPQQENSGRGRSAVSVAAGGSYRDSLPQVQQPGLVRQPPEQSQPWPASSVDSDDDLFLDQRKQLQRQAHAGEARSPVQTRQQPQPQARPHKGLGTPRPLLLPPPLGGAAESRGLVRQPSSKGLARAGFLTPGTCSKPQAASSAAGAGPLSPAHSSRGPGSQVWGGGRSDAGADGAGGGAEAAAAVVRSTSGVAAGRGKRARPQQADGEAGKQAGTEPPKRRSARTAAAAASAATAEASAGVEGREAAAGQLPEEPQEDGGQRAKGGQQKQGLTRAAAAAAAPAGAEEDADQGDGAAAPHVAGATMMSVAGEAAAAAGAAALAPAAPLPQTDPPAAPAAAAVEVAAATAATAATAEQPCRDQAVALMVAGLAGAPATSAAGASAAAGSDVAAAATLAPGEPSPRAAAAAEAVHAVPEVQAVQAVQPGVTAEEQGQGAQRSAGLSPSRLPPIPIPLLQAQRPQEPRVARHSMLPGFQRSCFAADGVPEPAAGALHVPVQALPDVLAQRPGVEEDQLMPDQDQDQDQDLGDLGWGEEQVQLEGVDGYAGDMGAGPSSMAHTQHGAARMADASSRDPAARDAAAVAAVAPAAAAAAAAVAQAAHPRQSSGVHMAQNLSVPAQPQGHVQLPPFPASGQHQAIPAAGGHMGLAPSSPLWNLSGATAAGGPIFAPSNAAGPSPTGMPLQCAQRPSAPQHPQQQQSLSDLAPLLTRAFQEQLPQVDNLSCGTARQLTVLCMALMNVAHATPGGPLQPVVDLLKLSGSRPVADMAPQHVPDGPSGLLQQPRAALPATAQPLPQQPQQALQGAGQQAQLAVAHGAHETMMLGQGQGQPQLVPGGVQAGPQVQQQLAWMPAAEVGMPRSDARPGQTPVHMERQMQQAQGQEEVEGHTQRQQRAQQLHALLAPPPPLPAAPGNAHPDAPPSPPTIRNPDGTWALLETNMSAHLVLPWLMAPDPGPTLRPDVVQAAAVALREYLQCLLPGCETWEQTLGTLKGMRDAAVQRAEWRLVHCGTCGYRTPFALHEAASGLVFTCPRCALHLGLAHSPSDFHRVMDDDSLSRVERLLRTLGAATATAAVATAAATAGGSGPATASSNPAPGPRPAPPIRLCAHPPFLYPIPESGLLYNKPYVTAHELVTLLSQLQPGSLRELGCKVQSGDRAVLVDGALCALLKGDYLRTTPRVEWGSTLYRHMEARQGGDWRPVGLRVNSSTMALEDSSLLMLTQHPQAAITGHHPDPTDAKNEAQLLVGLERLQGMTGEARLAYVQAVLQGKGQEGDGRPAKKARTTRRGDNAPGPSQQPPVGQPTTPPDDASALTAALQQPVAEWTAFHVSCLGQVKQLLYQMVQAEDAALLVAKGIPEGDGFRAFEVWLDANTLLEDKTDRRQCGRAWGKSGPAPAPVLTRATACWAKVGHMVRRLQAELGPHKVLILNQKAGEGVHVTPGWVHIVRNLQPCLKLARDLIVPDHLPQYVAEWKQVLTTHIPLPKDDFAKIMDVLLGIAAAHR